MNNILNNNKHEKIKNTHYYKILHVYINSQRSKSKMLKFRIPLDSDYSFMIAMERLELKLNQRKDSTMQWKNQASNFTTNQKVKVIFFLP